MAKQPRKTLTAALGGLGQGSAPREEPAAVAQIAEPENTAAAEMVRYTAYLPKPVHRQLKELAFTHDRKMHDFVLEGLDLVFREHGLRSIEELKKTDRPV